ncbi:hypothetical protein [Planococcus sp. PAMC 21323]|uniref:hypothetical protein n=1 Tax=Planococcus sp. PAMC 21323 TaxID=1526927 RepID=UPI0005715E2C|nr:hypothetical protein [Planococcus sp. PAMC 21323]
MKDFSFKSRIIYFGAIAIISLAFLALQLTSVIQGSNGAGSITLVILWSIMALFGIAGIGYAYKVRNRQKN